MRLQEPLLGDYHDMINVSYRATRRFPHMLSMSAADLCRISQAALEICAEDSAAPKCDIAMC